MERLELRGTMPCDCEDWSCADFGEREGSEMPVVMRCFKSIEGVIRR